MEESQNLCATPSPLRLTLRDRIARRLFNWEHVPFPFPEKPDGSVQGHGICVEVATVFDWKDRLRVLFGGVAWLKIVVMTENEPGRSQSYTTAVVRRPREREWAMEMGIKRESDSE